MLAGSLLRHNGVPICIFFVIFLASWKIRAPICTPIWALIGVPKSGYPPDVRYDGLVTTSVGPLSASHNGREHITDFYDNI